MRSKCVLILAALFCFTSIAAAQDLPPGKDPVATGYTVGPGDLVTVKVFGEPQFDFEQLVDDNGMLEVSFVKEPILASCMTESALGVEVAKRLSFYLKNPRVQLRVTDRKSRPEVAVYGEVKIPSRFTIQRKTTLKEVMSFVGGVSDKSNGVIQVTRTRPPLCTTDASAAWNAGTDASIPTRIYSIASVEKGGDDSNPQIFPGDIILVSKAPPVYVIGQVNALKEITIGENGLSLLEAVAQAGGFAPRAKSKDIKIRRLKANSRDREIISVNYDLIKKGTEKDVMLQPEDIVEVDKSPKSASQVILELVSGTAKSFTNVLPYRVMPY